MSETTPTDETKNAAREALLTATLAASWPDGSHDGFPTRRTAEFIADAILASPALDAIVAERVAGLAADELRVAALAHVIEWYAGPDDDTIPVLRHWLTALTERTAER